MTTLNQLQDQLEFAGEQLMMADTPAAHEYWGMRCDQLEAAIIDELAPVDC